MITVDCVKNKAAANSSMRTTTLVDWEGGDMVLTSAIPDLTF